MLTAGIDFASQPKNTALCAIEWIGAEARVTVCRWNVADDAIEAMAETADKVGLDAPIGWPHAFVQAVSSYHGRGAWQPADSVALRFRRTDLYVQNATAKWPLSVSSDRIACTAFRAAALLSRMEQRFGRTDRAGAGRFVEVYPRAARNRWKIGSLDELLPTTRGWLRIPKQIISLCQESAHCYDALVAALATRAAAVGLCDPIPAGEQAAAEVEGWIALPQEDSLQKLTLPA